MCLLFLVRERFGYANILNPVSIVCMKERSGYMLILNIVSVVSIQGEFGLYEHSYACVYYFCLMRGLAMRSLLILYMLFVSKRGLAI